MVSIYSSILYSEKYGRILCYPKYDEDGLHERIDELRRLGIERLEFIGSKNVANVHVLGKGCVGVVVLAYTEAGDKIALKIRRLDADRNNMLHESEMLKMANQLGIGPKLIGLSDNFLIMEYAEGSLLPAWAYQNRERKKLRRILKNLLLDCHKLDIRGLDHGELSNASKHIIVKSKDETPVILDFESSSDNRRPRNVQCICQYLFISSKISTEVKRIFRIKNIEKLMEALKNYKKNYSKLNFERILKVTSLTN